MAARRPSYFDGVLKDDTQLLKGALDEVYQTRMSYPKNESELRSELDDCGVDLDRVLDPWGSSLPDGVFRVRPI